MAYNAHTGKIGIIGIFNWDVLVYNRIHHIIASPPPLAKIQARNPTIKMTIVNNPT